MARKQADTDFIQLVRMIERDQTAEATQQVDKILANKVLETVERTKQRITRDMFTKAGG